MQCTCKGSTTRDFVWMSEALAYLEAVEVSQVFQGHSTVQVTLAISSAEVQQQVWPLPSPPSLGHRSAWTSGTLPTHTRPSQSVLLLNGFPALGVRLNAALMALLKEFRDSTCLLSALAGAAACSQSPTPRLCNRNPVGPGRKFCVMTN